MKTEIKRTKKNEVDWSKNPQLVISITGILVMVTIDQNAKSEDHFSGICMDMDFEFSGSNGNGWVKSDFKPFHGTVELSND